MTWRMWRRRVGWFAIFLLAFPAPWLLGVILTPVAILRGWCVSLFWRLPEAWVFLSPVVAVPMMVLWPAFKLRELCYEVANVVAHAVVFAWRIEEPARPLRDSLVGRRLSRVKRGRAAR